jgi:hypothetical protein
LTTSLRAGAAAVGVLSLAVLTGCGSSGSGGSGSSPSSAAVDGCLVNTWVSSAVSGETGGQAAQISGGTGEKVTIDASGAIRIDDSNTAPLHVTAQGQSAQIKEAGQGSGKVTTTGGNKLQVTLDSSTLTQQVFDPTGATAQGTPEPLPTTLTDAYTCSSNQLQITQTESAGSQTVTYVTASSSGGGASSSGTDTGSSSSSGSDTGGGSSSTESSSSST